MSGDAGDRAPERLVNPFFAGWRRYKDAEHDWRLFKETAERAIPDLMTLNADFAALEAYCGFYCHLGIETTVQVEFANRLMGRTTLKGATASEHGATLVYSFGPTGWVAVMLFPPKSELGRVTEDHIYLRIIPASAAKLLEKLPRDLRDLVRYQRVASLDGTPRIGERMRLAWLRYWSRMQVNGQIKAARSAEHVNWALEFSTGQLVLAMIMAVLKPVGVLIVVYLLIRFGMPHLAQILLPKG
ncbi:hypothetical protein AWL63_23605 (plasmid) [Sphingomonas panacis]|uniref:Uncharacterized protein n=1 Tax=Sphingomonas panacis TaxID=1560345 RepID=A0A1B3ZIB2_9SPHN|nr:hypothetical protein [Sphingomonas panacis]AOH87157.1 hypothetical protein AWL63_23605 [Sphingomonas panacis]